MTKPVKSWQSGETGEDKSRGLLLYSVHGTEIRIETAYSSPEYLAAVASNTLSTEYKVVVFRSRPFSLKKVDERVESLRAVIAVLERVKSGEGNDIMKLVLGERPF